MSRKAAKEKTRRPARKLDAETRARRDVLAKMKKMSAKELFAVAVRAGIYTEDGMLTAPYLNETPSGLRPGD